MSSWEGYHGGALPWIPTLRRVGGSGVEEELDTRRHGLSHKLYSSCMLVLWMLACCANFVLVLLGSLVPVPDLTSALQKLTSAVGKEWDPSVVARRTVGWGESGRGGDRRCRVPAVSQNPIGRALSHVLTLVNDVPSSSSKYAFLQDLTDRVVEENKVEGVKYDAINQAALQKGFARTINLLGQSLESRRQHYSFFGRLVSHLPSGGIFPISTFPRPLANIQTLIAHILPPFNSWTPGHIRNEAVLLANLSDPDTAVKFARELLWIAEKLQGCSGTEVAAQQWSSESSLAELALCASPRVQMYLVRLSALLCKDLLGNTKFPRETCLQLVLTWLPLLCNANHGGDGPIFSSQEKENAERELERLVSALPEMDQEQVLSTWLQAYAMSQSDWPNLINCFHTWCLASRKLEVEISNALEEGSKEK